jgi:hypothetical protein
LVHKPREPVGANRVRRRPKRFDRFVGNAHVVVDVYAELGLGPFVEVIGDPGHLGGKARTLADALKSEVPELCLVKE